MRTIDQQVTAPLYEQYLGYYNTPESAAYKRQSFAFGSYVSRSDVQKSPVKVGFRPPLPYSVDASELSPWSGTLHFENLAQGNFWKYDGPSVELIMPRIPAPSLDVPARLIARAEQRLIEKMRSQKLELANDILEARKTAEMLLAAREKPMASLQFAVMQIQRVARAYHAVKRGKWKIAARILDIRPRKSSQKGAANQWLEYRYGWLPVLMSAKDAYDLARSGFDHKVTFRTTLTEKFDKVFDYPVPFLGPNVVTSQVGHYLVKARCDYKLTSAALRNALQIGMADPAVVAYNNTAFTWMLEWFLPLENCIGAIGASAGLEFMGGSITTVTKVKRGAKFSPATHSYRRYLTASGESSASWFRMRRTIYSATPIPSTYLRNPFSVTHLLDALSVVRQLIK